MSCRLRSSSIRCGAIRTLSQSLPGPFPAPLSPLPCMRSLSHPPEPRTSLPRDRYVLGRAEVLKALKRRIKTAMNLRAELHDRCADHPRGAATLLPNTAPWLASLDQTVLNMPPYLSKVTFITCFEAHTQYAILRRARPQPSHVRISPRPLHHTFSAVSFTRLRLSLAASRARLTSCLPMHRYRQLVEARALPLEVRVSTRKLNTRRLVLLGIERDDSKYPANHRLKFRLVGAEPDELNSRAFGKAWVSTPGYVTRTALPSLRPFGLHEAFEAARST